MNSRWRKAKQALGSNLCLHVPSTSEEAPPSVGSLSDAASSSALRSPPLETSVRPTTPTPSSSGLKVVAKNGSKSPEMSCSICLQTMKPGQGHAIFTAECSHSFHFHCITSNVKHGNQICPVCRAKWKEIPFHNSASDNSHVKSRISTGGLSQIDAWMTVARRIPSPRLDASRQFPSLLPTPELSTFDDDEILDSLLEISDSSTDNPAEDNSAGMLEVKIVPEVSAIGKTSPHENFTILVHLQAPQKSVTSNHHSNQDNSAPEAENSRAPVDLVTVLDVSGSMAGTKLALLKRAMGFVIQNLGPFDRLSVTAFSSTARRLFPLRRMTEGGRQQAVQAVNSLIASGGTNIAEGLRKGAKVLVDRKWKNPVGSIILLSDGQDTYTLHSPGGANQSADYQALLPQAINRNNNGGLRIPVHTFGFGADHDAKLMHSIAEISGGTFSFIETESVIQDAFAQCIGGLLSVVVQDLKVEVESVYPNLQLGSLKAGSYQTSISSDCRTGHIEVGDLYAEEERDFLVTVNIPLGRLSEKMKLLNVRCYYKNPFTEDTLTVVNECEMNIHGSGMYEEEPVVSMEVDRHRNRLQAAEAMAEAGAAAEQGDLASAVSVLESCRHAISETVSARSGDRLCVSLCAELKEMQERMANRRVYETSGRAYVLSGLSSHSWQRATARGDSTDSDSLVQAYQTPSMVDMVTRSQTMILGKPPSQRRLRHALSFPARPGPR